MIATRPQGPEATVELGFSNTYDAVARAERVDAVSPDSPAMQADLRAGDRIKAVEEKLELLKKAQESKDAGQMKSGLEELQKTVQEASVEMYTKAAQEHQAAEAAKAGAEPHDHEDKEHPKGKKGKVVDAEFESEDDGKKK